MDTVKATVQRIIRRNVKGARELRGELAPELDLRADLGAHDLDLLQVIMDVEDAYEGIVYFDDDEAEEVKTVGDLERMAAEKVANPEEQAA